MKQEFKTGSDSLENTTKIFGTKQPSNFRQWLNRKWYEHLDECHNWRSEPCASAGVYFNKYKWWLKREYRQQRV